MLLYVFSTAFVEARTVIDLTFTKVKYLLHPERKIVRQAVLNIICSLGNERQGN